MEIKSISNTLSVTQLSVPSKRFLSYQNPFGGRLLLPQTTLSHRCVPFSKNFEDKDIELRNLEQLRHKHIEKLITDGKKDKRKEIEEQIKKATEELQDSQNDWDKESIISTLNFLKSKLNSIKKGEIHFVREFDQNDSFLIKIEKSIQYLKSNKTIAPQNGSQDIQQCQCCGIALPVSHLEEHIDFISEKKWIVCPLCHYTEHLDSAAEVNAGYISYLPMLTQEQINLFSYCYFCFKYMNEELRFSSSEGIAKQIEMLNKSLVSSKLDNFTFYELYENMKGYRNALKGESNKLVEFFKNLSSINEEELFYEYERTKNIKLTDSDLEIQERLAEFLHEQFQKYNQNNGISFDSRRFFSFNLDNMNLPAFYASLLIKEQVTSNSTLSKEKILNKLTRLEGIRFLPSYQFFKPFIKSWTELFITKDIINDLSHFVANNIRIADTEVIQKENKSDLSGENNNKDELKDKEFVKNDKKNNSDENQVPDDVKNTENNNEVQKDGKENQGNENKSSHNGLSNFEEDNSRYKTMIDDNNYPPDDVMDYEFHNPNDIPYSELELGELDLGEFNK